MSLALAIAGATPWAALHAITLVRGSGSRSLDEESAEAPLTPSSVSVVIPARNERRNIARCVRSVMASDYPALEVFVVDDHSNDDTGAAALAAAQGDTRFRVLETPQLPPGWFGKQWACTMGAATARGELLLFLDADTHQAPDLISRAVNALRSRDAALLSVFGRQEMHGFWERVVQPEVFLMLLTRYGSTETVNRARNAEDVIANGQCLLVRRDVYDDLGGHAAVRDKVAEDLALAQRFFREGKTVAMVQGQGQLSTHMYASLSELVRGWGKNIAAAGVEAMPGGSIGRRLFPVALVLAPLMGVIPAIVLGLALGGVLSSSWLVWSAICLTIGIVGRAVIYLSVGSPPVFYALLHPLGSAATLYIAVRALVRGRRVEWKGREYIAR